MEAQGRGWGSGCSIDQWHHCSVRVVPGRLIVRGQRIHRSESKTANYHHVESSSGLFMRSFSIPPTVRASDVRATLSHGVLDIDVPLPPPEQQAEGNMVKIDVK